MTSETANPASAAARTGSEVASLSPNASDIAQNSAPAQANLLRNPRLERAVAQESLTDDRTLEILYVGDFDPSGLHMSEVDLPGRVEKYGGVVNITRIALTSADCTDTLPSLSVETKRRDPRYAWFKRNYGARCWELDAMNPSDLRQRLRNEIIQRIDMDAWAHCQAVEAEQESLNTYIKAWPKAAAQ